MAFNLGINTMIGTIPGFGDVFSIWFRSNLKNARLLRRYTSKRTSRATPGDWLFVIGLLVGDVWPRHRHACSKPVGVQGILERVKPFP